MEFLKKLFKFLKELFSGVDIEIYIDQDRECDCMEKEVNKYIEEFSTINGRKTLVPDENGIIYYWVESYTKDMSELLQKIIFRNMWRHWEGILSPIRFIQTTQKNVAQVKIFFRKNGDADLPVPFKKGSIAYALAPHNGPYSGHMYINDEEDFTLMENEETGEYGLLKILTHEGGHILNVSHSEDPEDIMFWKYQWDKWIKITQDTAEGLKQLYFFQIRRVKQYLDSLINK